MVSHDDWRGLTPISLASGDLDGDGDPDLISANSTGGTLALFYQEAPGQFTPGLSPLVGAPGCVLTSVRTADLDGDGDIDLVAVDSGNTELSLWFQVAPAVSENSCAGQSSDEGADMK